MKKITEASTLSGLGIPDNVVKKIHTEFERVLDHDHEFEELKTKGQMQAKLKHGKLIIGFSPEGDIASIREAGGRYTRYYGTIGTKEVDSSASMKDILTNFPGRGWKWFATVRDWKNKKSREHRGGWRDDPNWEKVKHITDQIERVHGPQMRKEAAQYANEIRDHLLAFIDSDRDKNKERSYIMRGDEYNGSHMHYLRQAFKELLEVTKSDTPFHTVSSYINAGSSIENVVQNHLKDAGSGRSYYGRQEDKEADKYIRNAKLASAKIVKLYFKLLRDYRDKAIEAVGDAKIGNKKKATLGKVKKAWEGYKKTDAVNVLSEDVFDEYAAEVDPYSAGYKAGMYQEAASAFQAYKAWITEVGQSSASVENSKTFVRGWNDGEAISKVGI